MPAGTQMRQARPTGQPQVRGPLSARPITGQQVAGPRVSGMSKLPFVTVCEINLSI